MGQKQDRLASTRGLSLAEQDELRRRAVQLHATLYSIGDAVIATDVNGHVEMMNPVAERLTGWRESEARGHPLEEVFHIVNEKTRRKAINPVQRVLGEGVVVGLANHTLLISRDGNEYVIADAGAPIKDERGNTIGVVLVFRDVTAERQLEQRYQLLFDHMLDGFVLHEILLDKTGKPVDYRFLAVNPAFERMTGLKAQDILGRTVREVVPNIEEYWIETYGRVALTGEPTVFESYNKQLDKFFRVSAFRPAAGQFACIFEDITQARRIQQALSESEGRFRMMAENAQDLIYRYEFAPQRGFTYVSPSATRITGYTPEDHYADPDLGLKIVHPEDRPLLEQYFQGGGVFEKPLTLRWVRKDGRVIWTEQINSPVYDAQGNLIAIDGIARDVTERKKAEEAQRASERRLSLFMENLPGVVVIRDTEGRYTYMNTAWERAMNLRREDYLGKTPFETFPREDALRLLEDDRKVIETGKPSFGEIELHHQTGPRWWLVNRFCLEDETGKPAYVAALYVDISERKRHERLLEAQARVARALGETLELRPLLERLLEAARSAIPAADKGSILLTEPDGSLRIYAASGYQDPRIYNLTFVRDSGYCALAARLRQALLIPSVRDYGTTRYNGEVEEARQVLSAVVAPLIVQEKLIGVISLDCTERKAAFSEADMHTLVSFASTAALAIETSRLAEETRLRLKELSAVAQVSAALRAAQTRAEMPLIIAEQVANLLEADGAALETLIPSTGELLTERGCGIWAPLTGELIPPGTGISSEVLKSEKPYLNNDARHDPRLLHPELLKECCALAAAPLKTEQRISGLLWIARRRPLDEHDLQLLVAVAEIAANALQRAELHEETQKQLRTLRAIRAIDRAIINSLDLQRVLNIAVEEAAAQLKADAAAVLIFNPATLMLEQAAGCGFRTDLAVSSRIRLGKGHAGSAALKRRIVSIPDLSSEPKNSFARSAMVREEGFIAQHAAPLIAKNELKGVLEVFHRQKFVPDPEWLERFEAFADQAAIAIDNASLLEKLRNSLLELQLAYDETIEGWSRAMDLRDRETEGHAQRVTEMTLQIARAMGFSGEQLVHIRRGALLHDIGKLGVPDEILFKPAPLTEREWEIMRRHPQYAYDMLLPIEYLHPALEIPYCHHEKWDGTGYPRGLKGEEIPLAARIFAVADVYEALTSNRPYRKGWSKEEALEYIRQQSGKHFDPKVVEIFLQWIEKGSL
jgi:PAS domain S-box-containing protein